MFYSKATILATATTLVATVGADYYIDPNSVDINTRNSWCQSQTQTCPYICRDMGASGASVNTCNATTLTYGCLCNDNTTPNTSEYSLTLPYFTCTQWVTNCVAACNSDSTCQGACQQDHPCGATDPKRYNTTATASSSAASSTTSDDGSTVYTGIGGGDGSSAAGPPAFEMARLYATVATLGLFGMGFMYLL